MLTIQHEEGRGKRLAFIGQQFLETSNYILWFNVRTFLAPLLPSLASYIIRHMCGVCGVWHKSHGTSLMEIMLPKMSRLPGLNPLAVAS